jgi:signal transduction histidine kinase
MNRERVDLSELLARALAKQAPPEGIEVVTETSPDLPAVSIDPGQLEQVFANLVTNACQAMPDGGQLTIRALPVQDRVAVSVADTGCGISKESMGKVFEPLFTTKARGIGLGLAISKDLVEANGGAIEVASGEGGTGSTFTVFMPFEEATV